MAGELRRRRHPGRPRQPPAAPGHAAAPAGRPARAARRRPADPAAQRAAAGGRPLGRLPAARRRAGPRRCRRGCSPGSPRTRSPAPARAAGARRTRYADALRRGLGPDALRRALRAVRGEAVGPARRRDRRRAGPPPGHRGHPVEDRRAGCCGPRTGAAADGQGRVFHYPRRGFGQIVDALADAAAAAGARARGRRRGRPTVPAARRRRGGDRGRRPITGGARVLHGAAAGAGPARPARAARRRVLADAGRLRFRAMVLVYLVHDGRPWTPYDAHYLPGPETPVTRISEPANYRDSADDPADRTVLCAELPCAVGDRCGPSDDGRARRARRPTAWPPPGCRRCASTASWCAGCRTSTRSTRSATPSHLRRAGRLGGGAAAGHHVRPARACSRTTTPTTRMAMAYDAVAALRAGRPRATPAAWAAARRRFAAHVVED